MVVCLQKLKEQYVQMTDENMSDGLTHESHPEQSRMKSLYILSLTDILVSMM